MRNPIRVKNLRLRFLPFFAAAFGIFALRPDPRAYLVGACIVVAGELLRGWSAGYLVKTEKLTIAGPYAHLRHPLYAGTLLVAAGFVAMLSGWLGWVALAILLSWFFGIYFPRKERSEAARLEGLYGAAYADYRREVPALLPRLRPFSPGAPLPDLSQRWRLERYSENNELGTLLAVLVGLAAFGLRAWRVL